MTEMSMRKEARDLSDGVKVFGVVHVLVIQEDFLSFPVVVAADVRKRVPQACTDNVNIDI
jgi:hypothetical protein